MSISRRTLLKGIAASTALFSASGGVFARSGAINANREGLRSGGLDDQGAVFQKILEKASDRRLPVFVEPGKYRMSNVTLPNFVHVEGISGATEISYAGGKHFLYGENAEFVTLSELTLNGGLLPTSEYANSLIQLNSVKAVSVSRCTVMDASGNGIYVTGSAGRVIDNHISGVVGPAGFMGHNNDGLQISGNTIEDCANGGILVHRWDRGADNSIISKNRVRRISAIYGGTGQWGNGINTYLADGVMVNDNHVSDCAFSTIRSNSCSNIQISDNTCIRAGETSVYSEFAFEGAKISGNIIDGGATGVSMANFNEGGRLSICSNNLVRNIHSKLPYEPDGHIHGNGIYAEADTVINSNVIENSESFGVMLGWGPYLRNVVASSNIIRKAKSGFYVSVVDGVQSVSIANNIMDKLSGPAIAGYHWHKQVTGDLSSEDINRFSSLDISGNRVDS